RVRVEPAFLRLQGRLYAIGSIDGSISFRPHHNAQIGYVVLNQEIQFPFQPLPPVFIRLLIRKQKSLPVIGADIIIRLPFQQKAGSGSFYKIVLRDFLIGTPLAKTKRQVSRQTQEQTAFSYHSCIVDLLLTGCCSPVPVHILLISSPKRADKISDPLYFFGKASGLFF